MEQVSPELFFTAIAAIVGWTLAILQFFINRSWQKKDYIKQQRYEAYKGFMTKLDSINTAMRLDPSSSIFSLTTDFMSSIINNAAEGALNVTDSLASFSMELLKRVKKSCEPLQEINGEINNIKLIASASLLEKLEELQTLNQDLYNEMLLSLNKIGQERIPDFNSLKTVGQQARWSRFQPLKEEIQSLMRKEIGIE